MRSYLILPVLPLFLGLGCGAGNGENETLETVFDTPGGEVEVYALQVLVKEIIFDAEGPNGSISRSIPGTFDVDVIALESEPPYEIIELVPGDYGSPNFGVEIDDDVAGRSAIEMDGVFRGESGETPFELRFDSNEVFELERANLRVEEGMFLDAGRTFHPSRWFPTVDLNNATLTAGVIVITLTSNVGIFNAMADALDRSTQEAFTDGTFGI